MAGTETKQLLLQVDASVALAVRNLGQLRRAVDSDTASIEKSLGRVDTAHQRMGTTLGSTRNAMAELGHVGRATADQLAAGTPVVQILIQHMAQLGQIAGETNGALGKFGIFMGGPWGIALSLATVALAQLALGTDEAKDSVASLLQKMREHAAQAANNRAADELWKHTVEGLTEAIRKRREEQEKALKTDIQAENESLSQAHQAADENARLLREKERELAAARQALSDRATRYNVDLPAFQAQRARNPQYENYGLGAQSDKIKALAADVAKLRAGADNAAASVRNALIPIAERNVAGSLDKATAATNRYTVALGNLRSQLSGGAISQATFEKQLAIAQKARDRAIANANASTRNNQQFGRQVDFGEATSIARAAGFQVNSGYRSPAQQAALYNDPSINRPGNPVARPGTSAHNGANGKWAIDIQISDGVNPASIHKAFADQGVSLSRVFKEKGHYHVEGSRSDAARGERSAQSAADRAVHVENTGRLEQDRADDELRRAQAVLVTDIKERARLAEEDVRRDLERQKDAVAAQLSEHQISKADAARLNATHEATAKQLKANIEVQKEQELRHQAVELLNGGLGIEVEHLRALDQLAVSSREHRDIQRSIVQKLAQVEINAAKDALASAVTTKNQDAINRAQQLLEAAYQHRADALNQSDHQNLSPGQAYVQSMRDQDKGIQDRLDQIKVQGLDSLNQGLVEAIMGTKSLGSVFHDVSKQIIADLIQIAIRRAVIEPLANALFGGGSSGGGGFGGILSAIGGLFGGHDSSGGMSFGGFGNSLGAGSYNFAGARAGGGPVSAGSAYLVGERGPEIVVPRQSSVVIPNGKGMGGGQTIHVHVDARDAVLTHQVRSWIVEGMVAAADSGADMGIQRSGRMGRRIMP